jgi:hypothetical protein
LEGAGKGGGVRSARIEVEECHTLFGKVTIPLNSEQLDTTVSTEGSEACGNSCIPRESGSGPVHAPCPMRRSRVPGADLPSVIILPN